MVRVDDARRNIMAVLYKKYGKQNEEKGSITELDIDIRKYINDDSLKTYDEVIAKDTRWEVFYHLTHLRASLFNWYEFKGDAQLLEIGGEFGALTGLFCEKCAHVTTVELSTFRAEAIQERHSDKTNLDILAGRIDDIEFENKFDYIILAGTLENIVDQSFSKEKYSMFLKRISNFLKPDGKILLAVENRYGIRYFCGDVEPHTGKPFDGINYYPNGTKGYSFSRQELIDIVTISGFNHYKFYYPLPDYKLPQLIYSEEYLPHSKLSERLIPYYLNQNSLIAVEADIYDDLVDNHVFEFFSNSFLVECALNSEFCSVIFAAVTTDRGKQHGFATTIHNDNTVLKKALFKEGQNNIKILYENTRSLKQQGINVIPHRLETSAIRMPFIKEPTLSDYLRKIVYEDREQFLKLIDQLYDCILHSSEHVNSEKNVLRHTEQDVNFGIILKDAYIDMIPINCFYKDDKLLFFDQEFVKNNYPAKYIMFRALKYFYLFNPSAENVISLEYFKDKYELVKLWDLFEKEEKKFVSDNRNYDVYKNFYLWSIVDKKHISKNQRLLLEEEYGLDDEFIEKLKSVHDVQLDLLRVFKDICEKNKLRYFIVHGTLLGAARHKGFIPWDDDVDIAMPRVDYEELKRIAKDSFVEPYFFQSNENDKEYFRGSLSRLRNSNTSGIEYEEIGKSGELGIWIDIIALDYVFADPDERSKQLGKIQFYQKLLLTKTYGVDFKGFEDFTWKQRKLFYYMSTCMSRKWLISQFNKVCSTCEESRAEYIGTFTRYTRKEDFKLINKALFKSFVIMDFEDLTLSAPVGYRKYLLRTMGSNYMKYPPFSRRIPRHPGIFKANIPYIKFTGTFRNTKRKKFVIFGAGQMLEHYLHCYGKKHPPLFIVDNDKEKWNTKKHGIPIKPPNKLLTLGNDEMRLIICSIYYHEIGKQLEQMGIEEYYIYIQDKEWL